MNCANYYLLFKTFFSVGENLLISFKKRKRIFFQFRAALKFEKCFIYSLKEKLLLWGTLSLARRMVL